MEQYGLEPQVVLLCPLLVGTDGVEKMSQSLGNYVSVIDAPNDMFGKTMKIPDELIENWFELCTDVPMAEVRQMLAGNANPRDAKMRLGREIVALYHGEEAADESVRYFVDTFSKRLQPTEAEEASVPADLAEDGKVKAADLVFALGLARSKGQARDLIKARAVSLEGDKITDPFGVIPLQDLEGKVLKVGKHQFRKLTLP